MTVFHALRPMATALVVAAFAVLTPSASLAKQAGTEIEITGEVVDTWCYFSGVMGGTEAVSGSAHHTCALWCAAGGIPVGVRTEEGKVYMVLKIEDEDPIAPTDTVMEIASDQITAKGRHFIRDGVDYIIVSKIVANAGITNLSHEEWDSIPSFSEPKKAEE